MMGHAKDDARLKLPISFKEVYDAHFHFVWRSLRRLRVPSANLNDAVQDVFVVVHRRLPEFEGRSEVSTWLFAICLRVARDHRRRAHIRREVLHDECFAFLVDPTGDTGAAAERNQELALFETVLAELGLEQRVVFILFELENLTGDQIAEALAIPLGTVYSRLRLARVAFKRAARAQIWRWRAQIGNGNKS
jgi:RNA polymerase sigma-70 factor (ECF subfamily)